MIETASNYDDALLFVQTEQEVFSDAITTEMDSNSFNASFRRIETYLNNLYDKIRTVQEIRDYVKSYTTKQIEEHRQKIIDQLRMVKESTTIANNNVCIRVPIEFSNITSSIKDRDGNNIPQMITKDKTLRANSIKTEFPTVNAFLNHTRPLDAELWNESLEKDDDKTWFNARYRSFEPVENGVNVTYEINIDDICLCNYIDFEPHNCNILSVKIIDSGDSEYELNPEENFFVPVTDIKTVFVTVRCDNYQQLKTCVLYETNGDAFDTAIIGREVEVS